MKVYLKGGTVIEISLEKDSVVFNDTYFTVIYREEFDSPWTKCVSKGNLVLPFSYVERIEL